MNSQQLLRAGILLGFALLIGQMHWTGEIAKYINIKYSAMSLIACALLFLLFLAQLGRIRNTQQTQHDHHCGAGCDHHHLRWSFKGGLAYAILSIPLITGFLLPAKTLDAAMASKKGVMIQSPSPKASAASMEEEHPIPVSREDQLVYLDDLYEDSLNVLIQQPEIIFNDFDFVEYADTISFYPREFIGKTVELSGFVYKEEGMDPSQLVVARFIITHCLADAGVIGFMAEWEDAETLQEDTWVRVKGTLDITQYGDFELPKLKVEEWEMVGMPADPYVYPKLK
ncbi:TIGR03943 family protein [Ammoniphilus sp. YIM 78166]|uniref:TIGR03943 family putative permease subunit n=1 Tax=Ammoniphilus sp. YIM 78166 TaxID=1644106 RepID=UPI00106F582E|nr:TIGR03943 family protein [Ammoniphilus sp. YIM 78166]